MNADASGRRYLAPDWFTRNVANPAVSLLSRAGVSVAGSRVLAVRGRVSGEWRTNPVNVLSLGGQRYLVAPRGNTEWVRNLRAAGRGELRVGRRGETFTAAELPDADKAPVLRAYLKRWGWELGAFFTGLKSDSSDEEFTAAAPGYPVFRIDRP